MRTKENVHKQSGFSLPEILVVVLILSVVTGAIFGLINVAQGRYVREARLLDSFGQARAGMEQMVEEIHKSGYPPLGLYAASVTVGGNPLTVATPSTAANNNLVAATFLACTATDLQFESDLTATGVVHRIEYQLSGTTLSRSDVAKNADGSVPAASFIPLVDNVINQSLATPLDVFDCNALTGSTLPPPGNVGTVAIHLVVQSTQPDPTTGVRPEITLAGSAERYNSDR